MLKKMKNLVKFAHKRLIRSSVSLNLELNHARQFFMKSSKIKEV